MWLLTLPPSALAATLQVGPSRPYTTVQAAVDDALDGDTVEIDAGSYAAVALTARSLDLVGLGGVSLAGMTIDGGVVEVTAVDLDPGGLGRALRIDGGATVALAGVAIRGSAPPLGETEGGAILLTGASALTVTDGTLTGGAPMERGGLIATDAATSLTLDGDTLLELGVATSDGGAVSVYGGTLDVRGAVRFERNDAPIGGAVAFSGYDAPGVAATLSGATFSGNSSSFDAADLYHNDGDLVVSDCVFASAGFQVSSYSPFHGIATFDRTSFSGATDTALVVYVAQPGTAIRDCTFADNAGDFFSAGALWVTGTIEVRDATFVRNRSHSGAAIRSVSDSALTVIGGSFVDNVADGSGAAIYVDGSEYESGNDEDPDTFVSIEGTTFSGNSAVDDGGALAILDAELTLADVGFDGNTAGSDGGAIRLQNGAFPSVAYASRLIRATFVGNVADRGGALSIVEERDNDIEVLDCRFEANLATTTASAVDVLRGDRVVFARDVFCGNPGVALVLGDPEEAVLTNDVFVDGGARTTAADALTVVNNHFVGGGFTSDFPGDTPLEGEFANNLVAWGTSLILEDVAPSLEHHDLLYGNAGTFPILAPSSLVEDPLLLAYVPGSCDLAGLFPGVGSPLIDAGDPSRHDLDGSRSDIGAFGGGGADPTLWVDADSDGIVAAQDCDDGDAGSGAATPGWEDLDGDGLGGVATFGCPPGGVATGGDCDDDDAGVGLPSPAFPDRDRDGFGNPAFTVALCGPIPGYVATGDDCDDADPAVNPSTVWHADADDDGYGAAAVLTACLQPPDTVIDGTDCDDGDPSLNPETRWYRDDDGDGFAGPAFVQVCVGPPDHYRAPDDCDDDAPLVHPNTDWWPDLDFDGYGDDSVAAVVTCDPGGGSWSLVGGDCDDGDREQHPGALWFPDADGDGFGDPNGAVQSCAPPAAGWIGRPGDCDDTDATIRPDTVFYEDRDGDGFGVDFVYTVGCTAPAGYADVGGDCDDEDPARNPDTEWFPDRDGDGLGDDAAVVRSCLRPAGTIPVGGDCDDDDATVGVGSPWWQDADGDGYGDPDAETVACAPSEGQVANPDDCDDADPTRNPETLWHPDADGDGFGDLASTASCLAPEGAVLDDTDCDDTDPALFPNAPGVDAECLPLAAEDPTEDQVPPEKDGGCGCATSSGASWVWAALIGLAARRRVRGTG